jgi:hypothetical protein
MLNGSSDQHGASASTLSLYSIDRHLKKMLRAYFVYYHSAQTHLALNKQCPEPRSVEFPDQGTVIAIPHVGGLNRDRHARITHRIFDHPGFSQKGQCIIQYSTPPGEKRGLILNTYNRSTAIDNLLSSKN